MTSLRNIWTIFKRELASFFYSPLAYVIIKIFLLAVMSFAFLFGFIFERGEASLTDSFFFWHPWILMIVAPALGMRLWSEEQRLGTMELLLTMPIAPWQAIVGKFLASAVVLLIALILTFPIWITISILGDPDHGVIFAGYIASFMVALTFLAVTSGVSALTRSQVVAFIISVAICLLLILVGFPPFVDFFNSMGLGEFIGSFGVLPHFMELAKGLLNFRDLIYFATAILFCLFTTSVVIKSKRS